MNQSPTLIQIRDTLERLYSDKLEFAYLLGSAGTDRFHAESDIDLAVYWKDTPDFSDVSRIGIELEDQFNREVDLISLNTADVIFTRQVLETGRLLLNHSPGKLLQWQSDQLSQYPDFKFSRSVVEKNILNRKKYV